MARISSYTSDTNVVGNDRWPGSDWQTPDKITKNFTADAVASYFNKSAIIDTGQFSWEFLPYNNTQPQPEKTFMKVDWLDDTININNLAGVLRVSALTLGNTQPGAFIENEWVGNNILIHLPSAPSAYAIYTVDALVPDGDWYYLMTISYVGGQSFVIQKNEPVVMGYFAGANVITEITGTFPIIVSEGSIPDVSIDETKLGEWNLAFNSTITSASVTGTTTKTLTLTEQDGGTITASWTDEDTNLVTSVFGRTGAVVAVSGDYNTSQVTESTNLYFTQARAIASPITGYNPVAGTITASDTILTAINKLSGNISGGYVPYTGATTNVNLGEKGITAGYVGFDLTPTATPTGISTMYWDSAYRTVSLIDGDGDTTLQIGQEERILVHNNTGSTLTDGQVVYVTGSTGNLPSVALASAATESTSAATIGMITETILNGADGFITVSGIVNGLNTLAFNEGDLLWLSDTPGGFTTTKPISPSHLVLIGYVIKRAGGNGSILVKIQNTQELSESSDVLISAPEIDGQGLFLQTISGVQLWRNRSIVDVLGYTPADEATTLTINGTTYDLSANRTWSVGTVTSIAVGLGTSGTDVNVSGSPITSSGTITLNIPSASAVNRGLLTPTDWTTFNNKQDAGNYITSLTGEATASGPGAAAVTLSTPAVTGKLLTGVNITGGTVVATDTILEAFGKVQNQINGLVGGSIYKGTWNAATNTPTITSGVGNTGWYYIVSVSGSTNIDGITDWNLGDWIIFDGTAWQQVDNTDAVVSVNGYTGAVSLVSSDVPEGLTNLYFTNARARGAVSLTTTGSSGAATYDSGTGVFNIPNYAPDLSGYVPYTGATSAVNLGPYDLTVNGVLVGKGAGTGGESVILGYEALRLNTTGYRNVAIGARPLWNNTTGVGNVAIGAETLISAISGNINIAIGDNTAKYITTGSYNTVIGPGSGLNGLTTGSYNTIIGGSIASFGDVSNNIVLADGQGNIKYKWDGTNNNFYGNTVFSGNITASSIIKSGGTSSQFLKADGSLDSTSYQPLLTNPVTGTGTSGIVPVFNGTSSITDSTIYANSTRVSIGADVTTSNKFTAVASTSSSYAVVAQASGAANGFWATLSGTGEIFRGQTSGGSYFIINNGGNAFLNGNLNVGDFASTSYRLNVVGTANFTGTLSGTSATFSGLVTSVGTIIKNPASDGSTALISIKDTSDVYQIGYLNFNQSTDLMTLMNKQGYSASGIAFGTNNTERMRISVAGNVGIGTTSPTSLLDVKGSASIISLNNTSTGSFSSVVYKYADSYLGEIGATAGSGQMQINMGPSAGWGGFITFKTDTSERMRITSSGNVGIGTTSPSFPLQVTKTGSDSLIYGYNVAQFGDATTNAQGLRIATSTTTSGLTNLIAATNNDPSQFAFWTWTGSAWGERMRITSGGNVLIGTTTDNGPKLQVNSGIYINGSITNVGTGTGTYTQSVWYNNTTDQVLFENGRTTDSASGTGRTVYFTWRGGPSVGGGVQLQHGANAWAAYTSDARLKTIVANVENGIDTVMKLNPVKYKWTKELETSRTVLGFTAQNVGEAIPEAMFKSWKDEELGDVLSYYQEYLTPYLVKAIQELKAELDTYTGKNK